MLIWGWSKKRGFSLLTFLIFNLDILGTYSLIPFFLVFTFIFFLIQGQVWKDLSFYNGLSNDANAVYDATSANPSYFHDSYNYAILELPQLLQMLQM